jgi:spore coat protein U-like protein
MGFDSRARLKNHCRMSGRNLISVCGLHAAASRVLWLALLFSPTNALAQTCSVNAASGNYGSVDVLPGAFVDTTASFTVTCSGCLIAIGCPVNVCVQFGQGAPNSSSSVRYMGNGSNTVQHELYSDAGRTQTWGSWGYGTSAYGSAGVNLNLSVPFLSSATQSYTVYGRFKAGQQTAVPGTYTWTTTSPDLAYTGYLLTSPNCASNPGSYASAGSSLWTVTVIPNCYISATPLNFGTASFITANIDAAASLTVQCTNTTPYSISLDNGANASGAQRRMLASATSSYVNYGLYTDAARSNAWTSTTSATNCSAGANTCVLGTGTGSSQGITVYGRVPPQTSPQPGTYSDTVVVTITF